MKSIQVLVSTMNQTDHSLLSKMNIKTDAIVINQCDRNEIEEFTYLGHKIKWISINERGVGLSRNNALMRATADIILFADDDVIYEDDYENQIIQAFEFHPDASIITFNLKSLNTDRPEYIVNKDHRLYKYNSLKYGTFRIAVKRTPILYSNIFFSLLFGGGAPFSAGEDNLFITQCLKNGLKGYASSITIGTVEQAESTWFKGYNEKYYYDRGILFAAMYQKTAKLYMFLFELKSLNKNNEIGFFKRLKIELKGINEYRNIFR